MTRREQPVAQSEQAGDHGVCHQRIAVAQQRRATAGSHVAGQALAQPGGRRSHLATRFLAARTRRTSENPRVSTRCLANTAGSRVAATALAKAGSLVDWPIVSLGSANGSQPALASRLPTTHP